MGHACCPRPSVWSETDHAVTSDLPACLLCSKPVPRLPDASDIQQAIKATSQKIKACRVTTLGSLLRCGELVHMAAVWSLVLLLRRMLYSMPPPPPPEGPRQTFFAYQATRFADLYGTSCTNLLNYAPGFHFFAPHSLVRGGAEIWVGLTSCRGTPAPSSPSPTPPMQMPHENFHLSEVPHGGGLPTSPLPPDHRSLPKRFLLTKMKSTPADLVDDDEDGPNGVGGSGQTHNATLPPPHKQARL